MKKAYFISYSHTKLNGVHGFGNIDVTLDKPIKTMKDVREVQEHLQINLNYKSLIILNYIELEPLN